MGVNGWGSTPASRAAASSSSQGGGIMMSEGRLPGPVNLDCGSTVDELVKCLIKFHLKWIFILIH